MRFVPSTGPDASAVGPVAALVAAQIAAGLVVAFACVLLPGSTGLSSLGGLIGAMTYGAWAETKSPGCLPPRVARGLALRAAVVQLLLAAPFLAALAYSPPPPGLDPIPPAGWLAISLLIDVFVFLVSWLGLVQGRRMIERTRRPAA